MKIFIIKLGAIILFIISPILAQDDVQIGSLQFDKAARTGLFDFSDPAGINIKVQLWGYVRYPGYYIIPARSSMNDLISLSGGPEPDALIDDIRILRTNIDSSTIMFKYDYNDLMWKDEIEHPIKFPKLQAGDLVIVPGEPRSFARDDFSFYVQITSTLAFIASIIFAIVNK